jgi:hypothetical protein
MNQTLMGMAREMLFFKGLSSSYWVEVVHTTIYLRNQSPSSSLDGMTPYEAWYGFKPMIKHLRVFGSVCYALIPKEKRTKLDSRSMKCILVGYSEQKKGYRLLSGRNLLLARDVVFDETKSLSADEIEKQLSQLEKKVTKEQQRLQSKNKSKDDQWFEMAWTSDEQVEGEESTNSSQVNLEDSTQVNIDNGSLDGNLSPSAVAHKTPKWETQVLKEVKSDEKHKTGTRSQHNLGFS